MDTEQKAKYTNYISSLEWQKKRNERLKIDDYKCAKCGRPFDYQVHHITYDNIYNENVYTDLITLCKNCHAKMHELKNGYKQRQEEERRKLDDEERRKREERRLAIKKAQSEFICRFKQYDYSAGGDKNYLHLPTLKNDYIPFMETKGLINENGYVGINPILEYFKRKRQKVIAKLKEQGYSKYWIETHTQYSHKIISKVFSYNKEQLENLFEGDFEMQKPKNYENTQAQGEYEPIILGGHKLIIKQVTERTTKTGKPMLVVLFDFAGNDKQAGYFAKAFDEDIRHEKKWPFQGTQYIVIVDQNNCCSKSFKTFVSAVEKSNKGFICQWDDNFGMQFKNKLVGGIFGEEESEYNGEVKTRTKLRFFCELGKEENAKVPAKKTLNGYAATQNYSAPSPTVAQAISSIPTPAIEGFVPVEDSDIPF